MHFSGAIGWLALGENFDGNGVAFYEQTVAILERIID